MTLGGGILTIGVAALVILAAGCGREAAPDSSSPGVGSQQRVAERQLPDGLIVTDEQLGQGDPCPAGAIVTVNFKAMLSDGAVYDSSDRRKRPWAIDLSNPNLIVGLREGIPGMRVGGRRTLHVPAGLAYGIQGRKPVPPDEDLIFEIELLEFQAKSGSSGD